MVASEWQFLFFFLDYRILYVFICIFFPRNDNHTGTRVWRMISRCRNKNIIFNLQWTAFRTTMKTLFFFSPIIIIRSVVELVQMPVFNVPYKRFMELRWYFTNGHRRVEYFFFFLSFIDSVSLRTHIKKQRNILMRSLCK